MQPKPAVTYVNISRAAIFPTYSTHTKEYLIGNYFYSINYGILRVQKLGMLLASNIGCEACRSPEVSIPRIMDCSYSSIRAYKSRHYKTFKRLGK